MEGPQTMLGRPRTRTPLPIQRPPSSGAFTPAHCAPVFPVGQPTPGLARPSCPCLSRRPCHPSTRRMHRDAGSERPPQAASSTSAVRSCAAHELGSAPHNPDHSRQRVGIIQPGADGSAATPGLVSSPDLPSPAPSQTNQTETKTQTPQSKIRLRRTEENPVATTLPTECPSLRPPVPRGNFAHCTDPTRNTGERTDRCP